MRIYISHAPKIISNPSKPYDERVPYNYADPYENAPENIVRKAEKAVAPEVRNTETEEERFDKLLHDIFTKKQIVVKS